MNRYTTEVAALLMLLSATAATAGAGLSMEDPVTLQECDARVRDRPDELDSYLCYWILSRKSSSQEIAAERLQVLRSRDPDNHKATLYLALIRGDQLHPGAIDLARRAAAGLAGDGDAVGEARARVILDGFLRYRGELEEADAALARALEVARLSGDPEVVAQAETARAWAALLDGNYSSAWTFYRKLERDLFPDGPSWLQFRVLGGLGRTALATGRLHRSFDYYQRAADLLARHGNVYAEALDRYNIARVAMRLSAAGDMQGDEVRRLTDDALQASRRGANRGAESLTLLLRARLPDRDLPSRLQDARAGLALTRESDDAEDIGSALRLLAALLIEENPTANLEAALGNLDEAIDLARRSGWPHEIARAYIARAGVGAGHLPRSGVIADYLAAIEQIEKLRDLQSNRHIRGRFLWDWASAYYRLARFAFETPGANRAESDLDLAFTTMERLRGRLLIDLLDSAGATEAAFPAGSEREAFVGVRRRIAATQRRLLSPGLSPADRRAANADLERLELEESYLVTRLGRSSPSYATLSRGEIPALAVLQDALEEDQALIAYQVSPPDAAGARSAWAVVLTHGGKSVHFLPDAARLEERLAVFTGLLQRRDALENDAAARLYDDLMAGPLSELSDGIARLVIIPDGVLHRLPFGALREGSSGEPLAVRYEISLIPSAALWAYWKRTPPGAIGTAVLALADPTLPGMGAAPIATERFASLTDGVQLGRLPHARDEARAVVRQLGGASRLLTDDDASERFLKEADLNRFGLLHFATHAVVDDREPQRSAIVLAPGSPEEDGLLQLREMVAMDLAGKIVILSACSSASGELTAGEGVVGLARGLFQAGARAVVGSLWPLRDDEAAILVEAVAAQLGQGARLGSAVTAARRARIAAGAPSAAWAGLVVLGDADLVPLPGGREPETNWPLWGSLGLLAALAGLSWFLLARSRRQSRA